MPSSDDSYNKERIQAIHNSSDVSAYLTFRYVKMLIRALCSLEQDLSLYIGY